MLTLSGNHAGQVAERQELVRKHICSRILVQAGLGAMVLTVFFLLFGCGSDSTPGGAAKGKNVNKTAARPGATKPQPTIMLFTGTAGTDSEEMKKIKESPEYQSREIFPGVTQAELNARLEAERKNFDPRAAEVVPGVTQADLEAQTARQQGPDIRDLIPPAVGK